MASQLVAMMIVISSTQVRGDDGPHAEPPAVRPVVQKRKADFEMERKTFRTGLNALRRLGELSPIYRDGPFGSGSLFAETLFKINDDLKVGR